MHQQGQEASPLAEWTELENGCICCSAKNDMVKGVRGKRWRLQSFQHGRGRGFAHPCGSSRPALPAGRTQQAHPQPPSAARAAPAPAALESLMQQRDRFDYVLIETTGLANPGPVAAALWTDEQLESRQGGGASGRGGGGAAGAGRGSGLQPHGQTDRLHAGKQCLVDACRAGAQSRGLAASGGVWHTDSYAPLPNVGPPHRLLGPPRSACLPAACAWTAS